MMRGRIIRGELKPDARLTELEVAGKFGTSQGPVREALQMLEQEGLLERRAGRTMHVTAVSAREVHEYSRIRSTIEAIAIARTSERITDDELIVLDELVEAMYRAGEQDDLNTMVGYDMEFHRLICQWSGSPVLVGSWMPLYSQIQRFILQTHHQYFADLTDLASTHRPILEALQKKDSDQASLLIKEHIELIWNWLNGGDAN